MRVMMQTLESRAALPTRARLLAMFRDTAGEVVERDFLEVTEATVITELVIDSLGMLEIIGSLERPLRIQIHDQSLSGPRTVGDRLGGLAQRRARNEREWTAGGPNVGASPH